VQPLSFPIGPIVRTLARQRTASLLVVLELAVGFCTISCLLLASSWYHRLTTRPSGYDGASLVMVALQRPTLSFDAAAGAVNAHLTDAENLERMRAVHYVEGLAPVSGSMLDQRWNYPVEISALGPAGAAPATAGWTVYSTPEIAQVLGLRVLEGKIPHGEPEADLGAVTIITRCLRDRLFPQQPAVGRVVRAADAPPARVVAVVDDVVLRDPWNAHGSCASIRFGWPADEREARYLVRTEPGRGTSVMVGLRGALGETGPERRVSIELFDPRRANPTRMARGLVINLAVFGATVILIALLGALTVSSFLVSQRTRSIGIRRALGAQPRDIIVYFLLESSVLSLLGILLGLLLTAVTFATVMQGLYPGLELSWWAPTATGLLLWLGAALGTLLPARRAARIPPRTAASS
jgi:putative ABC transport system permease protein